MFNGNDLGNAIGKSVGCFLMIFGCICVTIGIGGYLILMYLYNHLVMMWN
jgi:hypothetical protein